MNLEARGRAPGGRLSRIVACVAVAAASLFTLWLAHAEEIAAPGISLRTDLGGHVVAIRHLLEVSLREGRILDWSHQWFAGYPSYYFHFPLPALLIGGLSAVIPLNIAAKAIAVIAPALLPPAAYAATRCAGFDRLQSTVAVLGTTAFLALTTHSTLGGNVLSSTIGEYSYALSLVFALLYLTALHQATRGAQCMPHMGVLLAAAALSHLVPTMFAVAASCSALRSAQARRSVVAGWLLGFGIAAFWAVPFLIRSRYMGRVEWPFTLDPALLLPWPILTVLPWTAAGAIVLWRSGVRPGSLALMGAAAALACLVPHTLFSPQRALPIAHLCLYLVTGLGIGTGLGRAYASGSRVHIAAWSGGILVLAGVVILQVDFVRARSYMLLTSSTPDSAAYFDLARTFAALPEGRLHAEHWTRGGGALGDRLSPGRLPAFDPRIRTTIGLLRESALTSPAYYSLLKDQSWDTAFAFMQTYPAPADSGAPARLARLRQLGVSYYVTYSPESRRWAAAQEGELREAATHPDWTIWHVAGANLVSPVRRVRAAGPADNYSTWLDELTDSTAWVLAEPRDAGVRFRTLAPGQLPPVKSATLEHRIVRFEVAAIGVPHIVRVSFFPNWRAYGADGPYNVLPGFMLVVPRRTSVILRFESTWVEWLGGSLTIGAFLVLLALISRGRWTLSPRQARNTPHGHR